MQLVGRTSLLLATVSLLVVALVTKEDAAVLWLSEGRRAAFEPTACFDDDGMLWALWISVGRGARPQGRIEGACVKDRTIVARFALEAEYVAGVDLAPFGEGIYCVFEYGPEDERALAGRTLVLREGKVAVGELERVPTGSAKPLVPRLAAVDDGERTELALVHQGLAGEQYDVFLARRTAEGWGASRVLETTPHDEWNPRVAMGAGGALHVVYDRFDGESFDVLYRRIDADGPGAERTIAGGPDYQGYPELSVAEDDGSVWITWETAASFGESGGLRGSRDLRIARLLAGELVHAPAPPRRVRRRELPRPHVNSDGLFVTYRAPARPDVAKGHLFTTWLTARLDFPENAKRPSDTLLDGTDGATDAEHVIVSDPDGRAWMVFATDDRRARFPEVSDWADAIEGRWRVGLRALAPPSGFPELGDAPPELRALDVPPFAAATREPDESGGPRAFFGDLHRHTHLSRCSGARDGTLADAYRYARGPGGLDFVAVTDHFQHVRSWSWWRSVREVMRYHAPESLVTFAAVERVRALRGHYNDVYRHPDEVPYDPDGWRRPPAVHAPVEAEDVVSIPHMMSIGHGTAFDWSEHADDRTRLFEVFQGTRGSYEGSGLPYETVDRVEEETSLARGLQRGAHFGLIASSDHLSTRTAYAGVWADELTRSAVFDALRARATFGATDARAVSARLAGLTMGERGVADADARSLVVRLGESAARGVAYVELVEDGALAERRGGSGPVETWIVSHRRGLPTTDRPLRVSAEGGRIVGLGQRRPGDLDLKLVADGERSFTIARSGDLVQDVWASIEWEAEDGAVVLERGDEVRRIPRAELPAGRSQTVELGRLVALVWRQGAPLDPEPDGPGGPGGVREIAFDVTPSPGKSYYARIAWTDGNLAWTSPIRCVAKEERQ